MAVPDGYGVATMHWSQSGGLTDITVTCGFEAAGATPANDIAETIESYWIAGGSPCLPANMTAGWTFVGVSVLLNSGGTLYAGVSYSNTVGTAVDAATAVPSYTPMVVTKRTALAGVRERGRFYPPFTRSDSENVSATGVIEAVNLGAIQATWDNLFTEWSSGAFPPVLIHQVSTAVPVPGPPTDITSFQVQPAVGIQRRRKVRA